MQVSRVQEVSLVNHVPHPLAVIHVTLTSLYAGKRIVILQSRKEIQESHTRYYQLYVKEVDVIPGS